ncbi:MAG: transglycosylase SLT domain-containing protein [bacterium]|nr:transglycosylase SLT domain-containing protein [bacterium]
MGKSVNLKESAQQMMEQALRLCQLSQEYWHKGELDRAIELLDQAYLLIVGINPLENENLIQQKEDLRITISRRLIEIYASRKIVVSGSQNEIPVNINEKVQFEIDLYTTGRLRNHFIASYKRSGKYRQMIVDMLEEENLPKELSWLPLVESGFKAKALSKMRALGLWQFIPSTGYKFGLSRNRYIDERLDPVKSTQAAVNYLKELHNHFGDWSTVLAAYNCGENRVFRVIRKQKIKYLDNFWDLYEHLPQETARYVPKFLAILHIVNNLEKYGMDKIRIQPPLKFESLTISRKIHLENAADIIGIDSHMLEELNPELRQSIIPGGNYPLKIPLESKQILLSNIDQILRLNPAHVDFIKHRVQSGETLSLIARRYHTSITNIMLSNNLRRAGYIVSGKTLNIPRNIKP